MKEIIYNLIMNPEMKDQLKKGNLCLLTNNENERKVVLATLVGDEVVNPLEYWK
ncbi:competence pheromone ComX [Heyndrickxia sporothermodurans]|uniref:ComX pheromone n=2 Tax=Heyndrickxia sporothermodurans TaxID=46224 RepID=A0A150KLH1_9BACI|nr:competence pheromone ComX [Heyndrickxia sporothermodurans]KYC92941.1 hypothetical protein B4102_2051 [Heyndrickxia sporothermodurans]MBL5767608.1 competence pheromone ComX [Heyndrickxia sporothermodurans]MBL5771218.1 competence pheromone ComX [Heyndrickxia sporothermodurans]MBL5774779.1 competence pheromone ComX [Heyndrickxia sporothermodurans]MBL5778209.1 competence pheromone ComX [Heyndrickxia sporothermodurans]